MGEQARLHDRIGGQHGEIGEVLGNQGVVDRDLLAVQPARVLPGQTSAPARAGEGERDPGKRGISRIFVRDAKAVTGRKTGRRCQSKDRRGARRREGHRADVRAVLLHIEHGFAGRGDSRVPGLAGKFTGRARAISASTPAVLRSGRCTPTSNGSVTGTSAVPSHRELLPGGDAREVHIAPLADRGAAKVRGRGIGSPDVGPGTEQHPVLKSRDLRRIPPAPRSRRSRPEGAAA